MNPLTNNVAIEAEVLANACYKCGICGMFYKDYKQLVEHLYWRHGTQGYWCSNCRVKRWAYTTHKCSVLPIDEHDSEVESDVEADDFQYYSGRETEFCFCGKYVEDAPMIGCDGPRCVLQWYHFRCVGIETAPEGDWLCPPCTTKQKLCSETTPPASRSNGKTSQQLSDQAGSSITGSDVPSLTSSDMPVCDLVSCDLPSCNLARWLIGVDLCPE